MGTREGMDIRTSSGGREVGGKVEGAYSGKGAKGEIESEKV